MSIHASIHPYIHPCIHPYILSNIHLLTVVSSDQWSLYLNVGSGFTVLLSKHRLTKDSFVVRHR